MFGQKEQPLAICHPSSAERLGNAVLQKFSPQY